MPERLAKRIASLPALTVAPDIVLVADKCGRDMADVSRTFLAVVRYFRLERVVEAARQIEATDYFRPPRARPGARLAWTRGAPAHGRSAQGGTGTEAMDEWVKPRAVEVERIRKSMHEIADTGLTISKLSVAASLLGDLAGR